MSSVAYYLPNVPTNWSTARYNHALAIADLADRAKVLTYTEPPPDAVRERYDSVTVLDSSNPLKRAREARTVVEGFAEAEKEQLIYLTTFHYAPALSGFLADLEWTVDMYDDPFQYIYNNPRSIHQVTTRVLTRLLNQADRTVLTGHPSTPHAYGKELRFAMNGSPTDTLEPEPTSEESGLVGVCAGAKGGLEPVLRGLARAEVTIHVDVYGDTSAGDRQLASRLGLDETIDFHGRQDNETVREAIAKADIGFALPPHRPDWEYAYFIKIGEYLAGGTVPIASPFRGIRHQVRDTGLLIEPRPSDVAAALTWLSDHDVTELKTHARERGEQIAWSDERQWFAEQALGDCWRL